MPKCLECGFESKRLQWTHFKYNCTGKISNCAEYKAKYPGAEIIDSDLAAKQAITLSNLCRKYGDEEGAARWESYRKKQAITNTYEYKKEKYGWTEQEFKDYNQSRSHTLENSIRRHGETKGIRLWEEYCSRQAYTKSVTYLCEKYGDEFGRLKYAEINQKKAQANDPIYLSKLLNISLDEAVNMVATRYVLAYHSQLEIDFVKEIEHRVGKLEYSNLSKPFGKWSHTRSSYFIYDIKHQNCIIEFNGDYWHANPTIYKDTDNIRGTQAKEIWARDKEKIELAESFNYNVKVVWETDYKQNKEKTLNEVCEWLKQNGQK